VALTKPPVVLAAVYMNRTRRITAALDGGTSPGDACELRIL